ncbi:unnamed protein product [Adineta steineri]|uniref:Elongation of very long chain fatty acids protein n=1 Tax=Adineta steineri TaxID=433720 RepID=A0A814ELK0_9BILA|nr:unnamed protein product [Adineta steineri]CAF1038420.1 unnamed protein product [Adineta steineri]
MVTIVSHISNYFEQFNSSLTATFETSSHSHNVLSSTDKLPLSFYVFDFERYTDQMETLRDLRTYMIQRWHNSFFYALAYLFLIYTGQIYMKNKPRFELRLWLAAWNTFLAIFSIFGAMRVLPELIYVIYTHGMKYSICNNSNAFGVVGFWTWAFCFSKLPELIDTVFIVLRKQPLIFLHWYHHASVLIYCWFSYQDYSSTGRWFCGLNYVVHGIMYSYYALRAMKFRIPRWVAMIITILQLNVMVELEIKQSQIPGAGCGLFTRIPISKDSCVCIYTGKVLRTIDAIRLEDKSYLMRLGPQVYVDPCDDTTVLARYINDPRNRLLQNVIFDKRPDEQCAYIIAKRDIAAGEEIFADYGRWYWLKKTPTRLDKLPPR